MPNGDWSPMADEEITDFFSSLGAPPKTDGGPQPCAPLWELGQALRAFIPEVIDDAFGRWGAVMLEVFPRDEIQSLSLEGDDAVAARLVAAGLDSRLAFALLTPGHARLAHLFTDVEIASQSWPSWDQLRDRAVLKGWRSDILAKVFG